MRPHPHCGGRAGRVVCVSVSMCVFVCVCVRVCVCTNVLTSLAAVLNTYSK